MKILIATDTYYPHVNGVRYFVERLAYGLKKRGHSMLVIAPSMKIYDTHYIHNGMQVFGISSLPVFIYKDFRISPQIFMKQKIEKEILKFNPDVVHFHNHFFISKATYSVAKKNNIPTVGTNHFLPDNLLYYFHLPSYLQESLKKWSIKNCRDFFEQADACTTQTNAAAEFLKSSGFSKPIYIISSGIDLKRFNPKNDGNYLRKKYFIPTKPILLYVGRLDKEKNIDVILRALKRVLKTIDIHFVIGGKGAEKATLEKLAGKLGISDNVTFTGFISDKDLPNIYRIADCFVIAGTAELQSIVTMEALASGLPAIAVNAVALPELVHHGKNGYLFQLNDINNLAKYIISIISNKSLQKNMSKKSLEIIKKHNSENTIKQFELLYKSLKDKQKNKPPLFRVTLGVMYNLILVFFT